MKKFKFNKLERKDSERLLPILNDKELRYTLPGLYCENLEDVSNMFNSLCFTMGQIFEIIDQNENTVGILAAEFVSLADVELSFFISKDFRNKHYASDSLKEFIMDLKEKNPHISNFYFFIDKDNYNSHKTVESIGAKFSHTFEEEQDVYKITAPSDSKDISLDEH